MQPPQYPYQTTPQPPQKRNAWQWYKAQGGCLKVVIALGVIFVVLFVCSAAASGLVQGVAQSSQPTPTPVVTTQANASTPTSTPTPKPQTHYPPKTRADLQALASQGSDSNVTAFHSESVGLTGVCPQPKKEVTIPASETGKKLAADLLAYYYSAGVENPCGGVVFAFHSQADAAADNGYTAGRVLLDVTDANGQVNTDPNASGLKYTLTLDLGSALSSTEYVVSWQS